MQGLEMSQLFSNRSHQIHIHVSNWMRILNLSWDSVGLGFGFRLITEMPHSILGYLPEKTQNNA